MISIKPSIGSIVAQGQSRIARAFRAQIKSEPSTWSRLRAFRRPPGGGASC
jgi:hypothetical protein